MNCHYCKNSNDLRPYGPRGAMVCFDCAMSTPARKAETENNFAQQLNASREFALIDGTETGPYPAKYHPIVKGCCNLTLELSGPVWVRLSE